MRQMLPIWLSRLAQFLESAAQSAQILSVSHLRQIQFQTPDARSEQGTQSRRNPIRV